MDLNALHKCHIVLLGGLYGSGKTEFAARHFANRSRYRVSRLEIRRMLFEMTNFGEKWTAEMFTEEDDVLVKHVERKIIEHYIHNKRDVLVINPFTSVESRARFVRMAKEMKKTIGIVFLDVPAETCLKNIAAKTDSIPDYVIQKLISKKSLPAVKEGFNEVVISTSA